MNDGHRPAEITTGKASGATPKVSIGMPIYNGEPFLEQTLKAYLNQTFRDFELVISDNGSTDGSEVLCRAAAAADPRVRYFRHARNRGAAANYNFALAEARADYFKWATHDDLVDARFLERCVAVLDAAPERVVLVYPRTVLINAKGKIIGSYDNRLDLRMARPSERLGHLIRNLTLSNPLFGLLRKAALLRTRCHGTYNEADRVMLAELAMEGEFWEFPDYLFLRRLHPGISTAPDKSARDIAIWFDPANARKAFLFPKTRLFAEHLVAVQRADLPLGETLACYAAFLSASWDRYRADRDKRRQEEQAGAQIKPAPEDENGQTSTSAMAAALAPHRAGDWPAAIAAYDAVLAREPGHMDALHLKGATLAQSGQLDKAVPLLAQTFDQKPDRSVRGDHLVRALQQIGAAVRGDGPGDTTRLLPAAEAPLVAWGMALMRLDRRAEALTCFDLAIEANPRSVYGHFHRGTALIGLERPDDALESLRQAVALRPDLTQAHGKIGNILNAQGDRRAAADCYRRVLEVEPENADAIGNLVMVNRIICDWRDDAVLIRRLKDACRANLEQGRPSPINPSFAQNLPFTSAELKALATRHAAQLLKPWVAKRGTLGPAARGPRDARGRLRIGYLSEGFRNFPTAHLIQGMFRHHDRDGFEIFAYSYGPDDRSSYRRTIADTVDHFVDIRSDTIEASAQRIHADRIDILVDLKGYTRFARPQIAALRPAPIQVSYLGYPGTWGCDAMDYVLVDRFVVPPSEAAHFTEQLVYLPHCYQVTDDRQPIAAETPSRAACGLPAAGFVFCCFNKPFKLEPAIFDVWMRILGQVPGSVLWLIRELPEAEDNLRQAAEQRGISGDRLVFADILPKPAHLARHRLADLFLDSYSYTAHTTGSDALWAGLPLITCPGTTFAARVAASLLTTLDLPALIARNLADYEERAVRLATDPAALNALRAKLARNRETAPLFDTARFARGLEAAYRRMWEIHEVGDPPRLIQVEPDTVTA